MTWLHPFSSAFQLKREFASISPWLLIWLSPTMPVWKKKFITTIHIHNFLPDIRGIAGNKEFENPGNKQTNRTSFLGKSQQQYQNILRRKTWWFNEGNLWKGLTSSKTYERTSASYFHTFGDAFPSIDETTSL